jgi:plastocyanin
MTGHRQLLLGGAVAAALVTAACGGADTAGSSSAAGSSSPAGSSSAAAVGSAGANLGTANETISASDALQFSPSATSAHVGDIVEWKNTGSVGHTVTFDSQSSLNDSALNAQGQWQVKFTAAGTYQYHCTIHPGMTGTVTVG